MSKSSKKWILTSVVTAVVLALALVGGIWQTGRAETTPTTPTTPTVPTLPTMPTVPTVPGMLYAYQNGPDLIVQLVTPYFDAKDVLVKWTFPVDAPTVPTVPAVQALAPASAMLEPMSVETAPNFGNVTVTVKIPKSYLDTTGVALLEIVNYSNKPEWKVTFGKWYLYIMTNQVYFPMLFGQK